MDHVADYPAAYDRVVREDDEGAGDAGPADGLPAFSSELFEGVRGVEAAHASYDDFAHHRRHAYTEDDDDVDEEEGRAAVHPREVGEFPEVAEADCGAGRGDDEADAASE